MMITNGDAEQVSSKKLGNDDSDIIQIQSDGDLVLAISHQTDESVQSASYRVSTASLKSTSKYFERLLSERFGEGQMTQTKSAQLRQKYGNCTSVPVDELPLLRIEHLGRISNVKSITALLTDFFFILHNIDRQTIQPAANLANLAVVADRFDALAAVSQHIRQKKIIQAIERKTTSRQESALSEEKIRQRLLVGVLLDHAAWVEKYSLRLVIRGCSDVLEVPDTLWWELPGCIEEEIAFRRERIVQTVQELQLYFVQLYTSRSRQCRLGYDSSAQCDSFQLGEMMRFFLRIGTLRVTGTLHAPDSADSGYNGDINALIEQLRQVPEYQIDSNHSHCGIRTRLIPALTLIAGALSYVGICGDCWRIARLDHSWSMAKKPPVWTRSIHVSIGSAATHERRHELVRSLFLAEEKQWD